MSSVFCHNETELTIFVSVKNALEPLAIANNVAQAGHCRIDHITLTLGNLFRIYQNPAFDDRMRVAIHGSLEKRWAAADQDVFILAAFLNPYIRHQPFSKSALSHADINEIANRVCRRVLKKEPNLDFALAFTSYYNNEDRYSKHWMHLDMMKANFENEVRCIVTYWPFP